MSSDMAGERLQKEAESLGNVKFTSAAVLIFFAVVATGLPQPRVIGSLPFYNLLSHRLNCNEQQVSFFFFVVTIPWLLMKPVFGLISDSFPIFKTRRRHYLMVSAGLSALTWLGFFWVPHRYGPLMAACFVANVFMAFGSSVASAVLVEAGRFFGALGRLTSVRVIGEGTIGVIAPLLGGMFAVSGLAAMAGFNASVVLILVPITYIFLREKSVVVHEPKPFKDAVAQIKAFFRSKAVWLTLFVIFLFYFAPGFGTVQQFRQDHVFGLSRARMGLLEGISNAVGLTMAFAYPFVCRKLSLRNLLPLTIVLISASNILYLAYSRNFTRDAWIDSQSAVFNILCELVIFNLVARATPVGCEGMGYSLFVGFRNFCLLGADYLGSALVVHKIAFWQLIVLNSGTTLCVLLVLPLLPDSLVRAQDGKPRVLQSTDLAPKPA